MSGLRRECSPTEAFRRIRNFGPWAKVRNSRHSLSALSAPCDGAGLRVSPAQVCPLNNPLRVALCVSAHADFPGRTTSALVAAVVSPLVGENTAAAFTLGRPGRCTSKRICAAPWGRPLSLRPLGGTPAIVAGLSKMTFARVRVRAYVLSYLTV